jgi:hypothetical protein
VLPQTKSKHKGGQFILAKYHFSQGQVLTDEGAFAPVLTKPEQGMRLSVLLILKKPTKSQTQMEKQPNAQPKKEKQ